MGPDNAIALLAVALSTAACAVGCGHSSGLTYGGPSGDGGEAGTDATSVDSGDAGADADNLEEAGDSGPICCDWGVAIVQCMPDGGMNEQNVAIQCFPSRGTCTNNSHAGTLAPCPICDAGSQPYPCGTDGHSISQLYSLVCICPGATVCAKDSNGNAECI